MKIYRIYANYYFAVNCGEVKAESEEEAVEKAINKGLMDSVHTLCYHCTREILDSPQLDEDEIYAEEV